MDQVLDPTVMVSIANLELRAKVAVEGFLNGLHKSPFRGFNVEFNEYRHYYQGDDIRHVDWKMYARTDKVYIKQYEDETNVRCYLMLDCSASMRYGSEEISKLEFSKTLAGSLAYFMMMQHDAVGLTTFNTQMRDYLPPRYRKTHLTKILATLSNLQATEGTDLTRPLTDMGASLKRRSLIVVISDLLDDEEAVISALRQLRSRGNDVIVFHVMDHAELTFPFTQIAEFVDLETSDRLTTSPAAIRKEYLIELRKFCAHCRTEYQASNIDYCLLDTSEPLDVALSSYLTKRVKSA
ncbi:MAG: DUF58 domain-containing protein [Pseudomonadales bacterium]|nr:DUF58 domain-containing protein [Pseudomonadales bacterium]MDP7358166.1 DUF58 domain-containing protein [Pseudomonadales bacterium]MDP7594520.1 DUF58 domain-containing protein [Pseudomonadales bacterium]